MNRQDKTEELMQRCMRAAIKRVLDLVVSFPMMIIVVIPMALVALAIKLDDGGPVFFRQERIGKNGNPFRVWKFRTMTEALLDPKAPEQLTQDDPRITRVGRVLRSLGIDELPQLLNVLLGEMSLVGPRPTLEYQVCEYTDFQRRRLEAKPGITSLAVVSGRNALSWEERIKLDVRYIDHWSMWLDVRILAQTLWKVLVTREGLYGQDGVNDMFIGKVAEPDDADHKGDRRGKT